MAAVGRCSFTIEAPAHQTRGKPASPMHAGPRNLESQILGLRLSRAGPAALRAVTGFWATTACPAHADSSRAASRRGGCHGPAGCHCGQQPRDPRLPAGAQGGSRSAPRAWPRLSPIVGTHRWGLAQDRWLRPRRQLLDSRLVVRPTPDLPPCSGRLPGLGGGAELAAATRARRAAGTPPCAPLPSAVTAATARSGRATIVTPSLIRGLEIRATASSPTAGRASERTS